MNKFNKISLILTISFVLIFSAGFTSAESRIQNFFGGQSGLLVKERAAEEPGGQKAKSEESTQSGGFLGFIRNLFGSNQQSGTKVKSVNKQNSDSELGGAKSFGNSGDEYSGPEPILNCLPRTVERNEPALIFWQCLDSSQTASATGFSTGGLPSGSTQINSNTSEVFSLSCSAGSYAECDVEIINPALAMTVNVESVPRWEKVNLSWSAIDMQNCELSSDDDNSKYKDWKRSGVCDAAEPCTAKSHPITKSTVFTLACTTLTGLERETSVTVTVQ